MSIFDTLVESGVTQEDLEKAASARLFAEAAAAEGIDLSELSEDQAEELYDFWANGGDTGEEKYASAEEMLATAAVKEASAKLAEAEYIGRYMARVYADEMGKIADEPRANETRAMRGMAGGASDEAKSLYNRAHASVSQGLSSERMGERYKALKGMVGATDISEGRAALHAANEAGDIGARSKALKQLGKGGLRAGLTAGAVGGAGYGAKKLYDRAHKKESSFDDVIEERAFEILEAAAYEKIADRTTGQAAKDLLLATHVRGNVSDVAGQGAGMYDKAKAYANILRGKEGVGNKMMTSEARKSLAAQLGAAGAVGGAGYGAKKMYDRHHKKESSAFEELALVRAYELLDQVEVDNALDDAAFDLLRANGYDV